MIVELISSLSSTGIVVGDWSGIYLTRDLGDMGNTSVLPRLWVDLTVDKILSMISTEEFIVD